MSVVCKSEMPIKTQVENSQTEAIKRNTKETETCETSPVPIFVELSTATTAANDHSSHKTITCNCPHDIMSTTAESVSLTLPLSALEKMRQSNEGKLTQLVGLMFLFPFDDTDAVVQQLTATDKDTETAQSRIKNNVEHEDNVEEITSALKSQLQNFFQIKSSAGFISSDDDNNQINQKKEQKREILRKTTTAPYYAVYFPNLFGANRLIPQDIPEDVTLSDKVSHVNVRSTKLGVDLICKPASGVKINPKLINQIGSCRINYDPTINYDDVTDTVHNFTIYLEVPKAHENEKNSAVLPAAFVPYVSQSLKKPHLSQVEIVKNDAAPSANVLLPQKSPLPYYQYGEVLHPYYYNNYNDGYFYNTAAGYNQARDNKQATDVKYNNLGYKVSDPPATTEPITTRFEDEEVTKKDKVNIWGYWNQFIFPRKGPATLNQKNLPFDTSLIQPTTNTEEKDKLNNYQKRLAKVEEIKNETVASATQVAAEERSSPTVHPTNETSRTNVSGCGCVGWGCPSCQMTANDRNKENLWREMLQRMYEYYWSQQYAMPFNYFPPSPNDSLHFHGNTSAVAQNQTAI